MRAKDRAVELYAQHIALASVDGTLFRRTVMNQLMAETGCNIGIAATHYNNAKKANPIEGLGRAPLAKGVRKASNKPKTDELQPDDECFAVIELLKRGNDFVVGRCQTFLMQGDASETFDEKTEAWPTSSWVLIQGLGPSYNETYKLDPDEKEIKRFEATRVAPIKQVRVVDDEDDEDDY
jgi:hypothetical protein